MDPINEIKRRELEELIQKLREDNEDVDQFKIDQDYDDDDRSNPFFSYLFDE